MLLRAKSIVGRKVLGADGDVGRVKDIYFDDQTWAIRYVVVDTGGWLDRNEVLLSATSFTGWTPDDEHLTTPLTREKVEASPPVISDMPVDRQYETRLHEYYGWTPYWSIPAVPAPGLYMYPIPLEPVNELPQVVRDADANIRTEGDPHLRSFSEIKGYHIKASDGEIGHCDDVLLDTSSFRVTHLIVDTRNWLPGRLVVVDVGVVRAISWEESQVIVTVTREAVKASPEYDPSTAIDEPYQARLSSYYRGIGDVASPRAGL